MITPRCKFVTGYAMEPHYWSLPESRRGAKREGLKPIPGRIGVNRMGVAYDVLCGDHAVYSVTSPDGIRQFVCSRDLKHAIKDEGRFTVEVLG